MTMDYIKNIHAKKNGNIYQKKVFYKKNTYFRTLLIK